ncbi:MAG: AAA family ATPase [Leptolyngbyaceae cyanobacterium SL_7_1]|nr:AAA family ATPase [Leptolyngbyaceae cyanobacterium SL_7_1]
MSSDPSAGFTTNWAYVRTELNWLERLLLMAVARQRKESKEIDRVVQSRADKITSHWWKGVVSLEGIVASDDYRKPIAAPTLTYHQQLETQIRQSRERGIFLALPALRDRLNLSLFEKNLIIMGLAPEVSRRYAQLYHYLQGEDLPMQSDLPTIDLALRLLCRTDTEWRAARLQLMASCSLLHHQLLRLTPSDTDSFLNQPIKLSDGLLSYLLNDQPTAESLERLLIPTGSSPPSVTLLTERTDPIEWQDLVVPEDVLRSLHHLQQSSQGIFNNSAAPQCGITTLWAGTPGTGKTTVAHAIAHALDLPLTQVDLASIAPPDYPQLCQEIFTKAPPIVLIQSAERWLKRSATIAPTLLQQFFDQRHRQAGLTIFTVSQHASVSLQWRSHLDYTLIFPYPDRHSRLLLWQRAFPATIPLAADIDWQSLAQLKLNGRQIRAIAQTAIRYYQTAATTSLEMAQIEQALAEFGDEG